MFLRSLIVKLGVDLRRDLADAKSYMGQMGVSSKTEVKGASEL